MNNATKAEQYAATIAAGIQEMLQNDEISNHIDSKEFADGENLKSFLHAVMNLVPTMICNTLTGEERNMLETNHVANQLCFEFMLPQKIDG